MTEILDSGEDKILDYGEDNVLQFIQTTIQNNNNVKEDILDKIKYVLGTVINHEEDIREDHSSQGFYYERLWDLCIKFGVTDLTLPAIKGKLQTFHIINENPNKMNIEFQPNCWVGNKLNEKPSGYLRQKVRSGNSGGYSDITFLNKIYDAEGSEVGEELYFISVKYFKQEKGISEYDIGKLCTLIKAHEKKNRIIKLYIFVKNKENAIARFNAQHSSSNILIKYINPSGNYEHIYDINDLQHSFFKLKKLLKQYDYLQSENNIDDFQRNYLNVLKGIFIPRFHQELFILKINKLIEEKEKNILVGAIPRSGKSYIMAGTILEYVKQHELSSNSGKKLKFLMMTPVPNETFVEYQSIFNNYIEFEGIEVITYVDGVNLKQICSNKDKHCVIIISKQKLGWKAGSKAEKLLENSDENENENVDDDNDENIKNIKQRVKKLFGTKPDINVMFLDEAHFGMSTEKAKEIVDTLNSTIADTIKIYVTATYNKPLESYGVKPNCKLTWDMDDIKIMQKLGEKGEATIKDNSIQKRFGNDIYIKTLEYFGDKTGESLIDKFKKEYNVYPKPSLITSVWDKEFLNVEKLKIGDTEFGWDMDKLFATVGDSDNFANEEQIKEMMRYYFGYPDKKEDYTKQTFYRTRGILPRIQNICLNKCRTLQPQHKTTQLWFLPLGNGKIKNKVNALITLFTLSEFKDINKKYHFFVAVDVKDKQKKANCVDCGVTYMNNPRDIKNEIEAVEKKIKDSDSADNLIILAGQRLQMGISLRNVDIVTLWNSISSADAIFQMLFRSMTEVDVLSCEQKPNEYCAEKKFGFMVDMNPQRALTNVNLFSANISKTDTDNIQQYRQITDLINIDEDVLFDKYGDDEKSKNDFVKDLFNKLYASWNVNVKDIKKTISKFTFDMTKLEALKQSFAQINIDNKNKNKNEIDEIHGIDEDEMIDPGKKKEKTGETRKPEKTEIKEKEINIIETATEVISEFISLLNIFTLYDDKGAHCILTDSSKSNSQITVIDDINILKSSIYQNKETKNMFLKILNGRLSGKKNADAEPYPEEVIDGVLDSMNNTDEMVVNKIIMSQKKQYYTINEPDKLLEFINGELKPKEKEKKENGEVFTPLSLVNEMLDKLDPNIFKNKDYKWLDPAVGIGNFPIVVYQRLMIGLKPYILDEEERRKHILEKMLYMVEISEKSIYILNKIFCGDTYTLNIHRGSFLSDNYYTHTHGLFDIILANPPYNPPKTETGSSGNSIWQQFVIKSFYMVKEKGNLLFIHPPGWKKPAEDIFDPDKLQILDGEYYKHDIRTGKQTIKQIRQGQVWQVLKDNGNFSFIYTNDQKNKKITDYIPFFPAVDYYVYQKNGKQTICNTKNIFLGETIESTVENLNHLLNYLPILITNETLNILHKVTTKGGKKPYFKRGIDERNILWDGEIIDWIYGANKKGFQYKKHGINAKTESGSEKGDSVGINKVVLNFGGGIISYNVKYISANDKIGVLDKTMYSTVETPVEGEHIELFFNSDIVKFIFLITQYASGAIQQNETAVANSITIPPKGNDDYYAFFGLTEKEKKYIEDILEKHLPKNSPIESPIPIQPHIPKQKGTLKKRSIKLRMFENPDDNKLVYENPIEPNCEKIFNPVTNRLVKNTQVNIQKIEQQIKNKRGGKSKKNRKIIEQQTLHKRGGKSNKTRKIKVINTSK